MTTENLQDKINELEAARRAYANELGVDVGDIHQTIREFKQKLFNIANKISSDGLSYHDTTESILKLAQSLRWKG